MFPDQICSGSNVIEVKRSRDACFMRPGFLVRNLPHEKKEGHANQSDQVRNSCRLLRRENQRTGSYGNLNDAGGGKIMKTEGKENAIINAIRIYNSGWSYLDHENEKEEKEELREMGVPEEEVAETLALVWKLHEQDESIMKHRFTFHGKRFVWTVKEWQLYAIAALFVAGLWATFALIIGVFNAIA